MAPDPRVCIVSASGQNVFFAEILEAFRDALTGAGYEVEETVDHFPPIEDDLVYMFIPHEYFPLVQRVAHPSDAQLRRAVAIGTEQPGTPWFELVAELAAKAGATVDINRLGAQELNDRDVEAEFVPLGYVGAWDHWHGEEEKPRSVDLAFLGGYNERRAHALATCAPVLRNRTSALYLTETGKPHVSGAPYFLSHERKWKLMADSRLMLNVHRAELGYLEWHRILGATLNGCVILSEHSIGAEPLVPGEHFVSVRYEDISVAVEALLADEDRLQRIRHSVYDLIRTEMPEEKTAEVLVAAVEKAKGSRASIGAWGLPAPSPVELEPPADGWEEHAELIGTDLPVRMALKHLVVRQRALERRVSELADGGGEAEDIVEQLGPVRSDPEVSVALTVYNYADHVAEALRSVGLSTLRNFEVVAVDDASTDNSVAEVRRVCEEMPWLSVKLVRRQKNGGLPAARNLAVSHAAAELIFVLDADNEVVPRGIELLRSALEQNPQAAFAYGVIETFGETGPIGLMSWLDWDPVRLRRGNYIDAMALIRRSALEAVGGYPTEEALYGWEDFSVWLAMASKGLNGVRVPQFVARYRVAPHSMISLSNIDTSAAWATLLRKYPGLVQPVEVPAASDV